MIGRTFSEANSLTTDKCRPHPLGVPNLFHLGARLCFIHSEHIAAIAVEEGRDPVIRDAVDVYRHLFQLLHDCAELREIPVGRVLKIDRYVEIRHTEPAYACRLVRQSLLMRVQSEIDDVTDAQRVDIREL